MSSGDKNVEELKRLVVHTLETNGVLGQIRAELRSNVYKVIDEDETRTAPTRRPAAKLMNSPMGSLMAEIVAEFFEFYEFRHSLSVFMPESNLGRNERRSRDQVAVDAGLDPRAARLADTSLLEQLVGLATGAQELRKGGDSRTGDDWHSSASSTTASSPPPAAPAAGMAVRSLPPHVNVERDSVAVAAAVAVAPKVDLEASPRGKLADHHTGATIANTASPSAAVAGTIVANSGPGHGLADAAVASTAGSEEHEEAPAPAAAAPAPAAVAAAPPTEDGAPEEASGARRKPRRKLPAIAGQKDFLSGANPGGPGQLPPLKASGMSPGASLSGASDRGGNEEVSLSESSVGVSRESCEEVRDEVLRLDRRLARFPGRPGAGAIGVSSATPTMAPIAGVREGVGLSPIGAATAAATGVRDFNSSLLSESGEKASEVFANDTSVASATSQVSSGMHGPARSLPRSPNSSPANTSGHAESPLRSPPGSHSPPLSPASRQASSAASPMGASFSPVASPKSSGSAARSASGSHSVPEDAAANQNESISIDENESSGDGDLDLALGGTDRSAATAPLGTGATRLQPLGGTLKGALAPLPSTTATSTTATAPFQDEEVDEEIDEEDLSNNSHESYQSSEAALSTGALSRKSEDAGF